MQLPPPQPRIQPGWAIAGKDAFLELGGARSVTRHFDAFGYDLTIIATATTNDIAWGDGSRTDGTRSAGGPWSDGDLTDVWIAAGTYDVVATRHWTGVWSLAGGARQAVAGQLRTRDHRRLRSPRLPSRKESLTSHTNRWSPRQSYEASIDH